MGALDPVLSLVRNDQNNIQRQVLSSPIEIANSKRCHGSSRQFFLEEKSKKSADGKFPKYLSGSGIIALKKSMFPHCREGSSTFHFYFFSLNLTVARAGGDE